MKLIHEATGAKVEVFNEERAKELLGAGFVADTAPEPEPEPEPEKKPSRRSTKKEDSDK